MAYRFVSAADPETETAEFFLNLADFNGRGFPFRHHGRDLGAKRIDQREPAIAATKPSTHAAFEQRVGVPFGKELRVVLAELLIEFVAHQALLDGLRGGMGLSGWGEK